MNLTAALTALALSNGYDGRRGCHSGSASKALATAAAAAQDGRCWLCGETLTDTDPGQADRLTTGRDLGVCAGGGDCAGAECRCGYRPGNVGAAHRDCHAPGGVRDHLTAAQVVALAARYVPTAAAMDAARDNVRADTGAARRERIARRTAAARER